MKSVRVRHKVPALVTEQSAMAVFMYPSIRHSDDFFDYVVAILRQDNGVRQQILDTPISKGWLTPFLLVRHSG